MCKSDPLDGWFNCQTFFTFVFAPYLSHMVKPFSLRIAFALLL